MKGIGYEDLYSLPGKYLTFIRFHQFPILMYFDIVMKDFLKIFLMFWIIHSIDFQHYSLMQIFTLEPLHSRIMDLLN